MRCSAGFVASWLVGQTMRLGPIELPGLLKHVALICRDVEATIWFYQDFLGFPLVELVENRDNPGSSHVFFDLGNRTLLGFFDLPGHEHPPFSETIRGGSTSPSRLGRAVRDGEKRSTSICGRTGRRRQPVLPRSQRDQPRAVREELGLFHGESLLR